MEGTGEFRIALTVPDFNAALGFYRDVIGLPVRQEWPSTEGRGVVLGVPHATLEILDQAHAAWVDRMEAGRRVSGPVRFAFQFTDMTGAMGRAASAGAKLLRGPIETPWGDFNARLVGPDGLQLTFFSPSPAQP
jgi:predicted enzyme related to lactoylglutathione lyase